MDSEQFLKDFQDHLAPKLDTYEQAIYLYIFRHSRLVGLDEATIGFKSARRRMAVGVGSHGTVMAEGTCYEKLASLEKKGCLKAIDVRRDGKVIRLFLPSEIPGVIPTPTGPQTVDLESLDFFSVAEHRIAILEREGGHCFYCRRAIESSNFVIEHVVSRPNGDNTYRNVVAACRTCNNKKGDLPADDFLRLLYRSGHLSAEELEDRVAILGRLMAGELKPRIPDPVTTPNAE